MNKLEEMYQELANIGDALIDHYNEIVTYIMTNDIDMNDVVTNDTFLDAVIVMANIHEGTATDHKFVTANLKRVEDDEAELLN